jgi:hypothetical protein
MIEPCIPLLVSECLLALAYNVPQYNTQARLLVQTSSHGTWRAGAHSLSLIKFHFISDIIVQIFI